MNDRFLNMVGMAVRAGKAEFGVFSSERAVEEGRGALVVAAGDIGASNKRSIEGKCRRCGVDIIFYSDKDSLSHAVGKKNLPVICICDEGFASAIVKIYGGVAK